MTHPGRCPMNITPTHLAITREQPCTTPIVESDSANGLNPRSVFLTETELAARRRISVKTLRNWRSAGTGCPYVKLGCVRYRLADILDHERKRAQRSPSQRHPHA